MTPLDATPAKHLVFEDSSPVFRVTLLVLHPLIRSQRRSLTLPQRRYTPHDVPPLTKCTLSPNDFSYCCTQKRREAQFFKECASTVNAAPCSSSFSASSLPPGPKKLQLSFVLWVWRRDNGPNSAPAQADIGCSGYSCLGWVCLSYSSNKQTLTNFRVFYVILNNLFTNIAPPQDRKSTRLKPGGKGFPPDPPHGACCHRQGLSSCTFLYCNFQPPNSLNPGCKLPGCKQGCMLLEQWWVGRWKLRVPAVGGIFLTSISKARSLPLC